VATFFGLYGAYFATVLIVLVQFYTNLLLCRFPAVPISRIVGGSIVTTECKTVGRFGCFAFDNSYCRKSISTHETARAISTHDCRHSANISSRIVPYMYRRSQSWLQEADDS
jgi:hypothetical protein